MSREPVRSHWWPRTTTGRVVVVAFLGALALAQPPVVWWVANRIRPWVLGMPFLYAWLLGVYVLMMAILIVAWRRGL